MPVRALFLADSHLGFDLPLHPRVRRRRRGHDFMANYLRALAPALAGEVDLVIHGGDLFHHPRVPSTLVAQAFEPLRRLADGGVPVFLVPGNHDGCRIPHARFSLHPGLHVFDRPRTFPVTIRGECLALLGFPYQRRDVRPRFPDLLRGTQWRPGGQDISLLCVHHCVEGARVGPGDYTFRHAADVIRGRDIPSGLAAVLTGHVHRHQLLLSDLENRPLATPVLYPGSIERTTFAEMGEAKGYLVLEVEGTPRAGEGSQGQAGGADGRGGACGGGRLRRWRFHALPARPMVSADLHVGGLSGAELARRAGALLAEAAPDAVLRLRVVGQVSGEARVALSAARLRSLAPEPMNVEVVWVEDGRRREAAPSLRRPGRAEDRRAAAAAQVGLFPP
jgi:DNA repair exonuclease SbcCD nuclease subunit